jgi:hypothetical protein
LKIHAPALGGETALEVARLACDRSAEAAAPAMTLTNDQTSLRFIDCLETRKERQSSSVE